MNTNNIEIQQFIDELFQIFKDTPGVLDILQNASCQNNHVSLLITKLEYYRNQNNQPHEILNKSNEFAKITKGECQKRFEEVNEKYGPKTNLTPKKK